MPRCVVIHCNENGRHHFPKDPHLRKLWERATRIKNFKSTRNSRLCSNHFKESDFQGLSSTTGLPQRCNHLREGVVPTIFPWTKQIPVTPSARKKRYEARLSKRQLFPLKNEIAQSFQLTEAVESTPENIEEVGLKIVNDVPDVQMEIQLECDTDQIHEFKPTHFSVLTQTPHHFRILSCEQLVSDSKSVNFYTGLESYEKFQMVLSTLLPMANHLTYRGSQVLNISIKDQFLLMLIKLRRNKCDFELSKFFNISVTEVGNIFVTWVNFVYQMWEKLEIWPSRELVDYYMPSQFKKEHKSTRVIVDGTEVPITRPKNPKAQQATFSSYKHHNTIKFLVGSTPGGLLSFCSPGYAGSTSDRQITERSSLFNKCEAKDGIMADRGFNVQDLFVHKDITILIPNFLKGSSQLPGLKLKHDRKLAANRIHIERLIGLAKTYKILKSDLNPFYVPLISKIFFICLMLCNFKEKIVNRNGIEWPLY